MKSGNYKKEVWRDVVGFEGLYEISNTGRVKALEKTRTVGIHKHSYRTYPEKIMKPSTTIHGYFQVAVRKNNKTYYFSVHRLVLIAFTGLKKDLVVNHINGIKKDNRIKNLEWCAISHNVNHAYKTGLIKKVLGDEHAMSKLKSTDIPIIRKMHREGKSHLEIAQKYKVNRNTIGCVVRGKTWDHIK